MFPEFKSFFDNKLSTTALFILRRYKKHSRIAKWNNKDLQDVHKFAKRIPISKFVRLRELARNTIGNESIYLISLLQSILNIYFSLDDEVSSLESQIIEIMKQYNSPIASILGISLISAATIVAEFEDISRFDNPN